MWAYLIYTWVSDIYHICASVEAEVEEPHSDILLHK